MIFIDKPLFTKEYENAEDFLPEENSAYIFGVTNEQRSGSALDIKKRSNNVNFIELRETDRFVIETDFNAYSRIPLRKQSLLSEFIEKIGDRTIYIDITGLGHSAWAPLTKVCLSLNKPTRVVYHEPRSYTRNTSSRVGEFYDLSERIEGIEPIPLFASLNDVPEKNICFIPLLGFEGTRFAYMLEEVQPPQRKTIPIIGVPGFQPDYPFHAFLGNASVLERSGAQRYIYFAKSNCPFSLYYALEKITSSHSGEHFKIGLIGTKPHALGATLFALCGGSSVELVYDHARRKKDRTSGTHRCLVYGVSDFLGNSVSKLTG